VEDHHRVCSGNNPTRSEALSETGRIYQCAIASERYVESGRSVVKRGINTVGSPRTAQTATRSGRQREQGERTAYKREKERGEVVGESEKERVQESKRDERCERKSERVRNREGARQSERAGQRDDHDARRRAQAARGTGLRAEGSTGP